MILLLIMRTMEITMTMNITLYMSVTMTISNAHLVQKSILPLQITALGKQLIMKIETTMGILAIVKNLCV